MGLFICVLFLVLGAAVCPIPEDRPVYQAAKTLDSFMDSVVALKDYEKFFSGFTSHTLLKRFEERDDVQNIIRPILESVFPVIRLITPEILNTLKDLFDPSIDPYIVESIEQAFETFNKTHQHCSLSRSRYTGRYSFTEMAYPLDTCPITLPDAPGYDRRRVTFDFQTKPGEFHHHVASPVIITIDNYQFPVDYSTFWALDAEVSFVSKLLFLNYNREVSLTEDFSYNDMNYLEKSDLYACLLHTNFVRQWGYSASLNSFGYISGYTVREGTVLPMNVPNKFDTHDAHYKKYCPFFTASFYSNCLRNICWGQDP